MRLDRLHPDLPGHAAAAAALPDLLRRAGARLRHQSLDRRRRRARPQQQRLPRRDLARLHRGDPARPVGGGRRARPALRATACATSSCRRPSRSRCRADGRLHGADHQGHVARRDHRLHRSHARRPDHQQRHLPAAASSSASWRRSTSSCAGRCRCWRRGWSAGTAGRSPAEPSDAPIAASSLHHERRQRHDPIPPIVAACGIGASSRRPRGRLARLGWRRPTRRPSTRSRRRASSTVGMLVDFPPYGTRNSRTSRTATTPTSPGCWPRTGASSSSSCRSPARTASRSC